MTKQEEQLKKLLEKISNTKDVFDETKKGFLVGTLCGIQAYEITDAKGTRIRALSPEEIFEMKDKGLINIDSNG